MSVFADELTFGRTLPRSLPQPRAASNRRVFRGALHAVATGLRAVRHGIAVVLTERRPSSSTLSNYEFMTVPGWGAKRP